MSEPSKLKSLFSERFEVMVDAETHTYRIHDRITGFMGLTYHSRTVYEDLRNARRESAERFNQLCEKEINMQRRIHHDGYIDKDV